MVLLLAYPFLFPVNPTRPRPRAISKPFFEKSLSPFPQKRKVVKEKGSPVTAFLNNVLDLLSGFIRTMKELSGFSKCAPRLMNRFFAGGKHPLDFKESCADLSGRDENEEGQRHNAEADDAQKQNT